MTRPVPHTREDSKLTLSLVGHSTTLINMYGKRILTDPVLFDKIWLLLWTWKIGMKRLSEASLGLDDIPNIEYILLSHAHMDHRDHQSLLALTQKFPEQINFICPKNTGHLLSSVPYKKSVTEIDRHETAHVEGLHIKAGETRHRWARRPREGNRTYSAGHGKAKWYNSYLIQYQETSIVFGGDTAYTESYKHLSNNVDIAIMPIGAYDPWEHHHCTPEQAVLMAEHMNSKRFVPMHFETFRLDKAHIKEPMQRLEQALANHSSMQLAINQIGGTFTHVYP